MDEQKIKQMALWGEKSHKQLNEFLIDCLFGIASVTALLPFHRVADEQIQKGPLGSLKTGSIYKTNECYRNHTNLKVLAAHPPADSGWLSWWKTH